MMTIIILCESKNIYFISKMKEYNEILNKENVHEQNIFLNYA